MRADVPADRTPHLDALAPPRFVPGGARGFVTGFIVAVLIALLPEAVILARLTALGEIDLFDTDASLNAETLHGTYVERIAEYKLVRATAIRPSILALGSSRVLYWRSSFFDPCATDTTCFYNAGGSMATVREAEDFARALLTYDAPRVLLIDVAHWHFDPNNPDNDHRPSSIRPSALDRVGRIPAQARELLEAAEKDPELRDLLIRGGPLGPGYRGVRAILKDEGFTPDGARQLGTQYLSELESETAHERTAEIASRVGSGGFRFAWFDRADPTSLAELDDLVATARAHRTQVVAFITPYSDDVADAIEAQPRLRDGFADVESKLTALFSRQDVPFVSFRRMSEIGCPPEEAIDGYHIGEVCSARLLLSLLADPGARRILTPYVRADHLRDLIAHARSDLLLGER